MCGSFLFDFILNIIRVKKLVMLLLVGMSIITKVSKR